jgi:hypothetical protein
MHGRATIDPQLQGSRTMRWLVVMCLGAALPLGLLGCRNTCEKVELELRAREEDVRHLREELESSRFHNQLLHQEMLALRGAPGPDGHLIAPTAPHPIRSIRLGRQTGGRNSDDCPWHDALQVAVEPLDTESQAVKVPGNLFVEAFEVSTEGLKRPLSAWQVPAAELRGRWQNGLFSTGYLVTLPWRTWPTTEKLRIVARFQLLDGRVFEADKDVTLRLPPESLRKTLPVPGERELPAPTMPTRPPDPTPTLPAPNVDEPAPKPPGPTPSMPAQSTEGPALSSGSPRPPVTVELLRPIPMPPEP